MKKLIYKLMLLAPMALSLMACGMDLHEIYESDGYNNPVFNKNYYTFYPKEIKSKDENKLPFEEGNKNDNILSVNDIELTSSDFTLKYDDASRFDKDINTGDYTDKNGTTYKGMEYDSTNRAYEELGVPSFGAMKKMNSIDSIFKYGYISKLYDGEMFCNGNFQLARVQIKEQGFGQIFSKEMKSKDYFAINFKSAINDPEKEWIRPGSQGFLSEIDFYINFYLRDSSTTQSNKFNVQRVHIHLDSVPTSRTEYFGGIENCYHFLAFSLKNIDLTRCCGYSIDYKWDKDAALSGPNNFNSTMIERIEHSLMLYEVFMPNSTWY